MEARPVLFSAPMVRAVLAGTKTVTRRLIAELPLSPGTARHGPAWTWNGSVEHPALVGREYHGPLVVDGVHPFRSGGWVVGRQLWVRETWRPRVEHSHGMSTCDCGDVAVQYTADGAERYFADGTVPNAWTMPQAAARGNVPGIHMPRWASRLTLEVTGVRVERLHDITDADIRAEGVDVPVSPADANGMCALLVGVSGKHPPIAYLRERAGVPYAEDEVRRAEFASRWDGLNAARAAWASSPWVWRVEFKRVEQER
jgi:hypothetical protein